MKIFFCTVLLCIHATFSSYLLFLLGPYHFFRLLNPSLHAMFLGISNCLEDISSLSHSIVFLYFFALITEEVFLISPCILWNSAFKWVYLSSSPLLFTCLLFTAICKASSDSHFAILLTFPWVWSWSLSPVQCHEPLSIVHQAHFLSDLSLKSLSYFHCRIRCTLLEQLWRYTPRPRSGAAAVLHWTGQVQGHRNPSKMVGTGAAVRRYPTSKGKGEAPARW